MKKLLFDTRVGHNALFFSALKLCIHHKCSHFISEDVKNVTYYMCDIVLICFLFHYKNLNFRILNLTLRLGLHQNCSEIKNAGNQMPLVNSFDAFSPWADSKKLFNS